jgi:hypothetical protein
MRKLLFIAVPMGGYEQELIKGFENNGFEVDFFKEAAKIDRSILSLWQRTLRSLSNDFHINLAKKSLETYERKIYKKYIDRLQDKYDYVLDFAGKARKSCLDLLKDKYQCDFILYLWDDLKHETSAIKKLTYFDRKYSFSQEDSRRYELIYRPNFFVDEYVYGGEEKSIDIFYKGTARDRERAFILDKIVNQLKGYRLDVSLFTKGGYLRNLFKVPNRRFFDNWCDSNRLSLGEMASKSKSAKVLLDIAYNGQEGLGLRPLEALAANCKLITTNNSIAGYDFYNLNNVFILKEDFSNLDGLMGFMECPFEPWHVELKYRYSLEGFISDLFNQ